MSFCCCCLSSYSLVVNEAPEWKGPTSVASKMWREWKPSVLNSKFSVQPCVVVVATFCSGTQRELLLFFFGSKKRTSEKENQNSVRHRISEIPFSSEKNIARKKEVLFEFTHMSKQMRWFFLYLSATRDRRKAEKC